MKVLALSGHTLKLDLVIIVDLLPYSLHLDVGVEAKDTPNTVLPLEVDLLKNYESTMYHNDFVT